jgi:hypothetical protein
VIDIRKMKQSLLRREGVLPGYEEICPYGVSLSLLVFLIVLGVWVVAQTIQRKR